MDISKSGRSSPAGFAQGSAQPSSDGKQVVVAPAPVDRNGPRSEAAVAYTRNMLRALESQRPLGSRVPEGDRVEQEEILRRAKERPRDAASELILTLGHSRAEHVFVDGTPVSYAVLLEALESPEALAELERTARKVRTLGYRTQPSHLPPREPRVAGVIAEGLFRDLSYSLYSILLGDRTDQPWGGAISVVEALDQVIEPFRRSRWVDADRLQELTDDKGLVQACGSHDPLKAARELAVKFLACLKELQSSPGDRESARSLESSLNAALEPFLLPDLSRIVHEYVADPLIVQAAKRLGDRKTATGCAADVHDILARLSANVPAFLIDRRPLEKLAQRDGEVFKRVLDACVTEKEPVPARREILRYLQDARPIGGRDVRAASTQEQQAILKRLDASAYVERRDHIRRLRDGKLDEPLVVDGIPLTAQLLEMAADSGPWAAELLEIACTVRVLGLTRDEPRPRRHVAEYIAPVLEEALWRDLIEASRRIDTPFEVDPEAAHIPEIVAAQRRHARDCVSWQAALSEIGRLLNMRSYGDLPQPLNRLPIFLDAFRSIAAHVYGLMACDAELRSFSEAARGRPAHRP